MESNFVQEEGNRVVSVWEVNKERLADMKEEIERCTKALNAARITTFCIYKVPWKFEDNNGDWYSPRIVSIGPYHNDNKNFYSDYKYQCLGSFLFRTKVKGIGLEHYMIKLHPLEERARECYSRKSSNLKSDEFLEMMVVDGSFILELFYKFHDPGLLNTDELLENLKWRLPYFYVDLLLLENQIPFFVLQQLFDISKMPDDPSLTLLALRFFNNVMRRSMEVIERYGNPKNPPLHLLDLVRSTLIPPDLVQQENEGSTQTQFNLSPNDPVPQRKDECIPCSSRLGRLEISVDLKDPMPPQKKDDKQIQFIPCISKLLRSGIKVRPGKADSFLEVKFKDGVVEMPSITINVFMRSLLLNCVAFEQCHESSSKPINERSSKLVINSSKVFTVYATFLDCLVNTTEDVQYLRERNVIENVIDNYNYLADDDKVALFINNLGKGLNFDQSHFYLYQVFKDVDNYYRNSFHVQCASFKYKYLNSPWSCISVLAATVLLLLTLAQTYFAFIGYVHPKK